MGKVRRIRNIPNKQKNPYRYPYGHINKYKTSL